MLRVGVEGGTILSAPPALEQGMVLPAQNPALTTFNSEIKLFVLVSAGTELTFFLVAGTVLCFGFSVRMMLITH